MRQESALWRQWTVPWAMCRVCVCMFLCVCACAQIVHHNHDLEGWGLSTTGTNSGDEGNCSRRIPKGCRLISSSHLRRTENRSCSLGVRRGTPRLGAVGSAATVLQVFNTAAVHKRSSQLFLGWNIAFSLENLPCTPCGGHLKSDVYILLGFFGVLTDITCLRPENHCWMILIEFAARPEGSLSARPVFLQPKQRF